MNTIGLIFAAANVWTYPRRYTASLVLGNLLAAVLVRNELFGRFLYLFVNTCFAKVCFCDDISVDHYKSDVDILSGLLLVSASPAPLPCSI
jgi:hypothetical protein